MKRIFLFTLAIAALFTTFTSCEKNNTVKANYDYIVVAPGESAQVEISGGSASINVSGTQWAHESDSIFSLSDFKRHSIFVTGNNEGTDTLKIYYNQGIHANGEFIAIPVCVDKTHIMPED